jgi:hypothetical protein
MEQRQQEFQLTHEQQESLEAIFARINEDARLDAAEHPKETLDALLSTIRREITPKSRKDPHITGSSLYWAVQKASFVLLPYTEERRRRRAS